VSKATRRKGARGERWLTLDRSAARRRAFTHGLHLVLTDPSFGPSLVAGTAPNWEGMAILSNVEKAKVRVDVLAFAKASAEERKLAMEGPPIKPKKRSMVERVKQAFGRVLGT
jgi:hypothetical protein